MKDSPTMEPAAGFYAGVSFFFIFPVSQHDTIPSKANFPRGIDRYYTSVTIYDFCLKYEK